MSLSVRIDKKLAGFHLRVSFEAENETLALLGASGSGKTMTMRCIAGVERPDRGRIVLDGRVLFDSERQINLRPQEREVGLLFQNYALFPNMTVEQNIQCGLRRQRSPKMEVRRWIEAFQLQGLEKRLPSQLSGGQQQRVALARCMASKPRLLMLDEPLAALDEHLRWQMREQLYDALTGFVGTTLYVTHDRTEAAGLCGRVCVLEEGASQAVVDLSEWLERPGTIGAARLAGFENVVRVEQNTYPNCAAWNAHWENIPRDVCGAAFRAGSARLYHDKQENAIACRIVRETENELVCVPMDRTEKLRVCPQANFSVGEIVWLKPDPIVWLKGANAECGAPQW